MIRPGVPRLLRRYLWKRAGKAQVDEEIRLHLELRAEQLVAQGMSPEEALLEALRRFERSSLEREALYRSARQRDMRARRRDRWTGLHSDLRQSVRALARQPRFALFLALTLSLGIGANAAMYGIVHRMLIQGPDHVQAPERLARVYLTPPASSFADQITPWIPLPIYDYLVQSAATLESAVVYRTDALLAGRDAELRPRQIATVGEGFFPFLGVQPQLGRLFSAVGYPARGEDVVVLSHGTWMSEFGGSMDVLGRDFVIDSRAHVIVGVAPAGFTGPALANVDAWRPLDVEPGVTRNYYAVAKLADDVALAVASADVERAFASAGDVGPSWARGGQLRLEPLAFDDAGQEPPEATVSRLLLAVTVLMLLIACANVVNLLLARVTQRRAEMSVRMALGSGRLGLARLHLAESLVLATMAGLFSLPIAYGTGAFIRRVLLPQVTWSSSPLSFPVLALTVAGVLATALLVGLLPGLEAGRTGIGRALQTARDVGPGRRLSRLHATLTVAQTGLSAVLLIGAVLFVQSYRTLRGTDLGFDADRVLDVELRRFPGDASMGSGSDAEAAVYERAAELLRGEPGVEGVATVVGLPLVSGYGVSIHVPGLDSIPALPGGGPWIAAVSPDYFSTMGTALLRGRAFTELDMVAGSEAVLVVSASMAASLWPGAEALGKCFHVGTLEDPCSRVVGIVEDVHRNGYREPPSMQYYLPLGSEKWFSGPAIVVRHRGELSAERIRSVLRETDARVAYVDVQPMESLLDPEARPWQLGASVLAACALLALLVAVVGVYGVLSYLVAQRRREVGIRVALGATRVEIGRLFVLAGARQSAVGVGLGVAVALASARWTQPLLYETSVSDPRILGGVAFLVLGASIMACVLPAHHAARVDPATSLRSE